MTIEDSQEVEALKPQRLPLKKKRGCVRGCLTLILIYPLFALFIGLPLEAWLRSNPEGAKWARAQTEMMEIGKAVSMYRLDHDGEYPKSLSQLTEAYPNGVPTDPFTKDVYAYKLVDDDFTLTCLGLDGKAGGKKSPDKDIVVNKSGLVGESYR
ncbi:MAG: type II secretion system protein GspG [Planctomycetota bacterium]|jgi:hypothetical protein